MQTACRLQGIKPFVGSRQVSSQRLVSVHAGPERNFDDRPRGRDRRGDGEEKIEFKHFLPLPKPKHLVYIKPTVAVVAGVASRSSVGVKMTAGGNKLERFVVEYFARSVK